MRLAVLAQLVQRVAKHLTSVSEILLTRRGVRLIDQDLMKESPTLLQENPSDLGLPAFVLVAAHREISPPEVAPEYEIARQRLDKLFPEFERLLQERSLFLPSLGQQREIVVGECQVTLEPDFGRILPDQVLLNLKRPQVGSTGLGLVVRDRAKVREIAESGGQITLELDVLGLALDDLLEDAKSALVISPRGLEVALVRLSTTAM